MVEAIIMSCFCLFLILLYVPAILYFKCGRFKKFYHNFMGWCRPDETRSFDGLSAHSQCKYCGKDIMQDSQGNWF